MQPRRRVVIALCYLWSLSRHNPEPPTALLKICFRCQPHMTKVFDLFGILNRLPYHSDPKSVESPRGIQIELHKIMPFGHGRLSN